MNIVVSNQVVVLSQMFTDIKAKHDDILLDDVDPLKKGLQAIYDPSLTEYDGANERYVFKKRFSDSVTRDLPLLVWNREPIVATEELIERGRVDYIRNDPSTGKAQIIKTYQGAFRMNFMYVVNRMEYLENFEVIYNTNIMPEMVVSVTYPLIPEKTFSYIIEWDYLEGINVQIEDQKYSLLGLSFAGTLRGTWMTFYGQHPYLKTIQQFYRSVYGDLFFYTSKSI